MKKRYSFLFSFLWVILASIISLVCLSAQQGSSCLTVKHYTVYASTIHTPLRIAQLSDLHSHSFGKNNALLVQTVAEQQPDLIMMTGDMMDRRDSDAAVVCDLIGQLREIAPIYYCYGNHEKAWMSATGTDLTPQLQAAGAVVLDTDFTDLTMGGQTLRIGGFHGYYCYWGMQQASGNEEIFAENFENTEHFKLLLNHIPTGWVDWGKIDERSVDLVLSGHYHGGQIRLPLIGALYVPYIGLFPPHTEGMYIGETATAIVSTGLGSSPGIPRIYNLPQIIVVDLAES